MEIIVQLRSKERRQSHDTTHFSQIGLLALFSFLLESSVSKLITLIRYQSDSLLHLLLIKQIIFKLLDAFDLGQETQDIGIQFLVS